MCVHTLIGIMQSYKLC